VSEKTLLKRIEGLKAGDFLWRVVYWDFGYGKPKREFQRFKIKKAGKTRFKLCNRRFTISKEQILQGDYSLSLKEAVKNTMKLQKEAVDNAFDDYKIVLKEYNFLKRKYKKLLEKNKKGGLK